MYRTIEETAEHLSMPVSAVKAHIASNRIRAVHDGEQYLVNADQFTTHFEQVELYKQMAEELRNEPLPEDPDIKDED